MEEINNKVFSLERSLYDINDVVLSNIQFLKEDNDGESPLKECSNITLNDCFCDLRYPMWHDEGVKLNRVTLSVNARAGLWYSNNIEIIDSSLLGIKVLRESKNINIVNTKIDSPEVFWRCDDITVDNCDITGEYAFFESKNILIKDMTFKGKYSFQYIDKMTIIDSDFDTKDAFWHSKDVTVKNSVIKGEYLGWYSENLTLIDCEIISLQPLCYCKNLRLINCKMTECELAFEYSDVEATLIGSIKSIKNPRSGTIEVDEVEEIVTEQDKFMGNGRVVIRGKQC